MNFSSRILENVVNEFAAFPGIGKKTALRYVLHLVKQDPQRIEHLGNSILQLKNDIKFCKNCHLISDFEVCTICANPKRDASIVCVTEDIRDVMAIENTQQYSGLYHVLGGVISPMEGIGPNDLTIDSLIEKVKLGVVKEIMLALSTTMEGETTNFYLFKKLKDYPVSITAIARGIAIGDQLEYTDEITLGRSIINRVPYENSLISK
ncbi:MAG: recombination protein RecR [Bacteroidetes bacterium]|nr:recombination protein RecR [Bacteroidota bacterium]